MNTQNESTRFTMTDFTERIGPPLITRVQAPHLGVPLESLSEQPSGAARAAIERPLCATLRNTAVLM